MRRDQDIADRNREALERATQREARIEERRVPRAYTAAELGEAGQTMADAEKAAEDLVNHPPHYNRGGIECIDAIEAALTPEEFRGYCKGNVYKYLWRERHKGGDRDIGKARWYIERLIETLRRK
jgi:hypothetical protein